MAFGSGAEEASKKVEEYVGKNLNPGELVLIAIPGIIQRPSVGFLSLFGIGGAFMLKVISMVLTNQRLMIVGVDIAGKYNSLTAFPLADVHLIKFIKGIVQNKLKVRLGDKKYLFVLSKVGGYSAKLEELANKLPK
jgi:hypothetical protein